MRAMGSVGAMGAMGSVGGFTRRTGPSMAPMGAVVDAVREAIAGTFTSTSAGSERRSPSMS